MLKFQTIFPTELKDIIRKFSIVEEDNPEKVVNSMQYFADGMPGLMFHRSGHEVYLNGNARKLSKLFLYGQTVKPIEVSTCGPFRAIAVHLFPHTLKSLFGIDAYELTDHCLPSGDISSGDIFHLEETLAETTCLNTQISLITGAMKKWLYQRDFSIERDLQFATHKILYSYRQVPLIDLHQELKISERTFQRKFLEHVGVTPRMFRRICRFYSTLAEVERNTFASLTDVAYDHGFADQSHFIRTFKEFTGFTPSAYLEKFPHLHLTQTEGVLEK